MKYLFIVLIAPCWMIHAAAQQLGPAGTNTAGGTFSNNQIQLDWNIGEPLVQTLYGNPMITLGILQPNNIQIVLPVQDLQFTAFRNNAHSVTLNWNTRQEMNNRGFYVERKRAGEPEFYPLQFITSKGLMGNSSIPQYYETTDSNSFQGISLYRIRQVDFGGNIHYSEVKTITGAFVNSTDLRVWPIPSRGTVHVRNQSADPLPYRLIDASGKQIRTGMLNPGIETVLSDLHQGVYYLNAGSSQNLVKTILVL